MEGAAIYKKSANNFIIKVGDKAMAGFTSYEEAYQRVKGILAGKVDFVP